MLGLKIENISKSWSEFKLKNIDLTINDGDYFIIIGPTGAGKTLLLETIMGFHKPDEGRIVLNGKDITGTPPEKRNIGYVSQNCVLFPHMNVRQNVEFSLKMKGVSKTERTQTVNHLLEFVGLESMAHRRPATLSGGERQKVALARALAMDSPLILLDEPLASIDVESSRYLRRELKRIHVEQKKTVVHVTHNLIEGFGLADMIALMQAGNIVQVGGSQEILAKPKNEFAARLLGYENVFKAGIVQSGSDFSELNVDGVKLRVSGKVDHDVLVAIRPEDIKVETSLVDDSSCNVLDGKISDYTDLGPIVILETESKLHMRIVIPKNVFIEKELDTETDIYLYISPEAVKVIE